MAIKKISANLLGNNAVTAASIAGGAISAADIADNSIGITQLNVSDGTNGQVLTTNGSGTLSFVAGYTDSDVESYLDTGTSTPTFGAMNTNGAITLGNSSYWIGNATHGYRFNNSADTANLLVIKDNGNVIVGGNYTPDSLLHVEGASHTAITIQAGTDSSASLRLKNDAHDWDVNCQTTDTFAIFSHTDGATRFAILPTSGNVGIGTSSPDKFTISGGASVTDGTTLTIDSGSNTNKMPKLELAAYNVANGNHTGQIIFGHFGGDATADGYGIIASERESGGGDGAIALTFGTGSSGTERMRIDSSGNLYMSLTKDMGVEGTTGYMLLSSNLSGYTNGTYPTVKTNGPSIHFDANGVYTGYISYNTGFVDISDEREKENILTITNATEKLKQLRGVTHTWKDNRDDGAAHYGLIAQEVRDIVPEVVTESATKDGETEPTLGVSYQKLVPLLIETIKELEARITELENA